MRITLWPACVRTHDLRAQLAAAKACGYTHLPIGRVAYKSLRHEGLSDADIVDLYASYGIKPGHYDGFSDWAPVRFNDDLPDEAKAVFDSSADECLEICQNLGIDRVCATGTFHAGQFALEQLSAGFHDFCRQAEAAKVQVDLEFLPMWGVPDLETAWKILTPDRPNNGHLMIDSWHFYRGNPDLELLESLPPGTIETVQLADALHKLQNDNLFEDCLCYRRPPGEGELDLQRFLEALSRQNVLDIGPEIFSIELDQLDAQTAARNCLDATMKTLKRADWSP